MTATPSSERPLPPSACGLSLLPGLLGRGRLRPLPVNSARDAINVHVGSRVRALRISQGKTQVALGEALGLTNQQVQKYEKGANSLNLERLWLISRYLDVDLGYLLEGIEAAALSAEFGNTAAEPVTYRRLRLEVAEALRQVTSRTLLSSMLQLLRASAAEAPEESDAEHGDG